MKQVKRTTDGKLFDVPEGSKVPEGFTAVEARPKATDKTTKKAGK